MATVVYRQVNNSYKKDGANMIPGVYYTLDKADNIINLGGSPKEPPLFLSGCS